MVGVPIHDEHPFAPAAQGGGRHRDVVEQAEAHGALGDRMMTGGSHRAERGVAVAAFEGVDRLEPTAGREQSRLPGCGRRAGVAVQPTAARGAEPLEMVEVSGSVDALELVPRRGPGLESAPRFVGCAGLQAVENRPHPGRSLRMTTACVVLLEVCVRRDQ